MKGNEKTYFLPEECIQPFVVINGMVMDEMCSEQLTISEIRQELHKHLRANGFDAVFFYDPRQILTMYDTQSSFVLFHHRVPKKQELPRLTADPRMRSAPQPAPAPQPAHNSGALVRRPCVRRRNPPASDSVPLTGPIYTPLRSDATFSMMSVQQNLQTVLTREGLRCALVFYNLEQWKSGMTAKDAEILSEMNRLRETRRSIAVFLVPSKPGQDIETLLTAGGTSNYWSNFAGQYLLPIVQRRKDVKETDYRLITLEPPGKGELRNFLTMLRLRHQNPLSVDLAQLTEIVREFNAKCSEKYISLSYLRECMEGWIKAHPGQTFTIESVNEVIGGGRYRSAMEELNDTVGLDNLRTFFEENANQQKLEKNIDNVNEDVTRLTPRQTFQRSSTFGLNLLMLGNPGTGKSKSVELVGKLFRELKLLPRGHSVQLTVNDILQHNFRMEDAFRQALGGVLVIDEAYGLMDSYAGQQAINNLTDCMSRYAGQLSVVLAGYEDRIDNLLTANQGLSSRFPGNGRIVFPPYKPEDLYRIFLKMLEQKDGAAYHLSDDLRAVLPDFFDNWVSARKFRADWGNARSALNLMETMTRLCSNRYIREGRKSGPDGLIMTEDDIPLDLADYKKPRAKKLEQALEILDKKIIGMNNVKQFIMNIVNDVKLHGAGSQPLGAYLFMGPPGTGKSMMGDQIAQLLCLLNVIENPESVKRTAKELLNPPERSSRPGQPTNQGMNGLREAVEAAKGGVLFIDEAHQLAASDTTNGIQSGTGILKELLGIMDTAEFRTSTCLILAGYTGPIERMLTVDQGFASRFPPKNRIRFTNYSADELVKIMESFAAEQKDILTPDFIRRSRIALSHYLPTVGPDFGNARWIRNEYLPQARAKRDKRLLAQFSLGKYEAPADEQLAAISPEDKRTLTAKDIPDTCGLSALAGPLDVAPPPILTPSSMLDDLLEKKPLVDFVRNRINPQQSAVFLDSINGTGINFALSGPTGSGRRTAIRAVAEVFAEAGLIASKEIRYFNRGNLVAGYIGKTPEQTRAAVSDSQGGVAVIVNPSDLCRDTDSGRDFGPEAVQELANCIADYSSNTCFVLMDSKEGLERFFRFAPSYRRYFQNSFELKDLSIETMQEIFNRKIEHNCVFEESIRELMKHDFIANWVTDRGGLGDSFQNWTNGAEIDALLSELKEAWSAQPQDRRQQREEEGYPVRVITRDLFSPNLQKYLVETSLQEADALERLNNMVGWEDSVAKAINLVRVKLMTASDPEEVVPGNYLFIGNPGTGKTEAARMMGSLLKATNSALKQGYVIERTAGQMMDHLEQFDKIIDMARNNVLFIDEAHQLADSGRGHQVVKRLLTVLEDPKVKKDTCIILAVYPHRVDDLLRVDPGLKRRFGQTESRVYFRDYTAEELEQIMFNMGKSKSQRRIIGARAPLDLENSPDFVKRARLLFDAVTSSGDPNYGNAGFVRNFLHNSVNRQILRLAAKYGETPDAIPAEEYAFLTADDVPEEESRMIRRMEKSLSSVISSSELHFTAEGTVPIVPENTSVSKAKIGHSVMLLEISAGGSVSGYGTGFVISRDGLMLTCAHVIKGAESVRARMYWPGLPGGPEFWFDCDILQPIREDVDMALLQIKNGSSFVPLNLRDADHPVGDSEYTMIVGYPFADQLNPDLSKLVHNHFTGHVSSIQNAGTDIERCFLDGAGKSGNSGSPVLSQEDGRVVGVFIGSECKSDEQFSEEMNYFHSIRLFWKYFVRD